MTDTGTDTSTGTGTDLLERPSDSIDLPWQTVVWNDPVNLMSYVVRVFRKYFGYDDAVAHGLMLAVHHDGHAVVAEGAREQMELHTQAMHDYGLWATVRQRSNE